MAKRFRPGQAIRQLPGGTWNSFVDTQEIVASWMRSGNQTPGAPGENFVRIKNDSGADLARFAILGIDTVLFTQADNNDEFKNHFTLVGSAPDIAVDFASIAILQEAVSDEEIGVAMVYGITPVVVDMDETWHTFARMKDANTSELISCPWGPYKIVWSASTSGSPWCLVSIVQVDTRNICFNVDCWKDGGSYDGDQDNKIDRTYRVKWPGNTPAGPSTAGLLGTGMNPEHRYQNSTVIVDRGAYIVQGGTATDPWTGKGYFDDAYAFVLKSVPELIDTVGVL